MSEIKPPRTLQINEVFPLFERGVSRRQRITDGFDTVYGLDLQSEAIVPVLVSADTRLAEQSYKIDSLTMLIGEDDRGYEIEPKVDTDWNLRRSKLARYRPGRIGDRAVNCLPEGAFYGLQTEIGDHGQGHLTWFKQYCAQYFPDFWLRKIVPELMPAVRFRLMVTDDPYLDAFKSNPQSKTSRTYRYFYPESTGPLALPNNPTVAENSYARDGLRMLFPRDFNPLTYLYGQFFIDSSANESSIEAGPEKEQVSTVVIFTDWKKRRDEKLTASDRDGVVS